MKNKKMFFLIICLSGVLTFLLGYGIGFRSGCLKVIGNSENVGAAMDLFCYGGSDRRQESMKH